MTLPDSVTQMYECNLLEKNEREIEVKEHAAEVILKPYEIKTYRILLRQEGKYVKEVSGNLGRQQDMKNKYLIIL